MFPKFWIIKNDQSRQYDEKQKITDENFSLNTNGTGNNFSNCKVHRQVEKKWNHNKYRYSCRFIDSGRGLASGLAPHDQESLHG